MYACSLKHASFSVYMYMYCTYNVSQNIDLHALTGWIPERIGVKSADDTTFKMMEKSLKKGQLP